MLPKKEKQVAMTYKYKMYRSKSLRHLDRLIDYHCEVYNYCIALHRRYYKMYRKHLSANKLKVHLTKVRKRSTKEHWQELGSQSIQDVAERIDRSYKAFFDAKKEHRGGRHSIPHFCKRKNYSSFTLKQAGYKFHDGNHITIFCPYIMKFSFLSSFIKNAPSQIPEKEHDLSKNIGRRGIPT